MVQAYIDGTQAICEKGQWSIGRNIGIELAQAAGRRIARIRETLIPTGFLRLVQSLKVLLQHQHLATHFE